MQTIFSFILGITANLGYLGVGLLMVIESSFLPFPSELVVPPAAYLASMGEMNIFIIILIAVLGSVVGALVNYFLAASLGRFLVYKLAAHPIAKFLMISPEKIERAEKYFLNNSNSATFIGRLIPVIRQLVSIPAGLSRMPLLPFISLTALGSFIWVSILAALGYFLGSNQALLHSYYREVSWVLIALLIVYLFFKFRLFKFFKKKKKGEKGNREAEIETGIEREIKKETNVEKEKDFLS